MDTMIRILLSACFLLLNTLAIASPDISIVNSVANLPSKQHTLTNGTLSIIMQSAPAGGLSIPRVLVLHHFIAAYKNNLNWGDTWDLSVPAGDYKIFPLPVSDGTNLYVANSMFVSVPPSVTVSRSITYQLL
jgi:hypothetical protein